MQNHLLEDEDFVFAPIIIPTLNRVEHLKRCIDSLAQNTWANHTDIYISVDYPPTAKYEDGYSKVCHLLENYDFKQFKSHCVIYQKKNLGPYENFAFLEALIKEKGYTRYISTEDDNEFSPNFIEYMNKCFMEYDNDSEVIAVCGCRDCNWIIEDFTNIVKVKLYAAYGVGQWFEKNENLVKECTPLLLDKRKWTWVRFIDLYKKNKTLFSIYVLGILSSEKSLFLKDKNVIRYVDSVNSIYMHITNKCCIAPGIAKSRTWGNDGSGVNMPARENLEQVSIDDTPTFKIENSYRVAFNPENFRVGDEYMSVSSSKSGLLHAWLNVMILFLTFKNRDMLIKFEKIIQKLK